MYFLNIVIFLLRFQRLCQTGEDIIQDIRNGRIPLFNLFESEKYEPFLTRKEKKMKCVDVQSTSPDVQDIHVHDANHLSMNDVHHSPVH